MVDEKLPSDWQHVIGGKFRSVPNGLLAHVMKRTIQTRESRLRGEEGIGTLEELTDILSFAAQVMRERGKRALRALERHRVIDTGQRRKQGLTLDPRKIDMHPGFLAEIQSEHPFGGRWQADPKRPGRSVLVFDEPQQKRDLSEPAELD